MYPTPASSSRRALAALLAAALCLMSLAATAESYTGSVNADSVLFRKKPSTSSDHILRLNKGAKVTLLGVSGDFYHVAHGGRTGYLMKKFVTVPSGVLSRFTASLTPKSKSKYAKTGSIRALGEPPGNLRYGDSGEDVEKLQRALQLKKAYEGVVDGKFGNQTVTALKVYQKSQGLRLTGRADYDTILALFGRVCETSATDDPRMKGITSISRISVPRTSRRGDSGSHVTALQQALKLKGFYRPPIDGRYGDSTVKAVSDFQRRQGLAVDGAAGFETIRRLFGRNAANYSPPTEQLEWFRGGSLKIPKGAVFTVKDIYSGITFSCKRWSGINHLDAEPLNADSAARMKRAYGGSWSWSRRPVLVKYNGHVYAASMNGMPHGTGTINGNGFDGHFCIHFHNSRTHGSNRVDAAHQNCVNRAMKASF